ncbi:hypothetical protein [Lutibacter sp.]
MRYRFLFYIGFPIILLSFNKRNDSVLNLNNKNQIKDSIVQKWKNDSLGCKSIRNIDMCNDIVNKYDLQNAKSEKILKYLGNPNRIENKVNWIYYIYSECDSKEILIDSLDKSWVNIRFNQNMTMKRTLFGCN